MRWLLPVFLILILSQLSASQALAVKKKTVTAPAPAQLTNDEGEALIAKFQDCDKAARQINGNINAEGGRCVNGQAVKAGGEQTMDELLKGMGYKDEEIKARGPKYVPEDKTKKYEMGEYEGVKTSVMTEEEANALHKEMRNLGSHMRFGMPQSGCAPRAHLIASALQDANVTAGKIWLQPGLLWGRLQPILPGETKRSEHDWGFHVASYVLVKKDGKLQPYIMDPSMDRVKPMALEDYKARVSDSPNRIRVDFTGPYGLYLGDRYTKRQTFRPNDLTQSYGELGCVGKDTNGYRNCKSTESP